MDETLLFSSYKFHVFDSPENVITDTYLFSQNNQDNESQTTESNLNIVSQWIFPDDSVHSMKLKLSKAIGEKTGTYPHIDSMYLYMRQYVPSNLLDVEKMYLEITKNNTVEINLVNIQTFLDNFSINIQVDETSLQNVPKLLEQVQEEMNRNAVNGAIQYVPIGFQYANLRTDYTFAVNPYLYSAETENGRIRPNILVPYDHHVLLRYFPIFQNEIYVCFSKNFDEKILPIYFPKDKKAESIDTRVIQNEMNKQQVYDYFYRIYQDSVKKDSLKMRKTIRGFTLIMMNQMRIPLDIIFKNISTDTFIPCIIHNPGKYKENVLRLYSTRISKSGKRIPVLNKQQITNVLRYVKTNTITYYLPRIQEEQFVESMDSSVLLDIDLFVRLDSMGNLHIQCDYDVPNVDVLNDYLLFRVNPLIQKINAFLQKSGYMLPKFESIYSPYVGMKYFHESWILKTPQSFSQNFSILNEIPCIRNLFDVYEDNGEKIVLKYKRVYNEEESQSQLIREMMQRSYSTEKIIQALI